MKIKGTAVKTILEYLKEVKPELKNQWFESLPEASKNIFSNPIIASSWYEIDDAMIIPTKKLSELLNLTHEETAWKLGRFSSKKLLKGVYKIFLRVSSPIFVLERAKNVMSAHYNPGGIEVIGKQKNSAIMKFTDFKENERIAIYRIAGWIEKTIETTGFKNIKVEISKETDDIQSGFLISPEWS